MFLVQRAAIDVTNLLYANAKYGARFGARIQAFLGELYAGYVAGLCYTRASRLRSSANTKR